ncbi:MAG: cob(I)yrinic acid a,c-diamide adenosyltransferase [Clostridia bacterium]|nr:cob(I)yrinic acid a,c-diamide adenosyltransferase [Clostridia bacterium]
MSFKKGYVQVYTGNGKGKTTAAIGLAIRALGAGKKVLFLQFMKTNTYSEHKILPNISPNLTIKTIGKPFFVARKEDLDPEIRAQWENKCVIFEPGNPPQEYVDLISQGIEEAKKALQNQEYDLVILDEINVSMYFELAPVKKVLELIEEKSPEVELVLTGRNCPQEIIDRADLVTEMREIKHYYTQGVQARVGIEN